jgi:hypothetical protein
LLAQLARAVDARDAQLLEQVAWVVVRQCKLKEDAFKEVREVRED